MGVCILERDYLDFIEHRLGIRRSSRLILHSLRCAACRRDLLSWPHLRRIVRRLERVTPDPGTGFAENVMDRIRCVQ